MSDALSDLFTDENEDETVYLTVSPEDEGERADVYLAGKLDITRSAAQKLLTDGSAVLADGSPLKKNARVSAGDEFAVTLPDAVPPTAEPEDIPLDVVYEDGDIIVVNKPQGMVVHPAPGHGSGTLVSALLFRCGDSLSGINGVLRPGIIHRIDKDTSGLICAAKNDRAHVLLSDQLRDHSMRRTYRAIVIGGLPRDSGTVDAPIDRSRTDRKKMATVTRGGRDAVTHYSVISRLPGFTYAEMKLETGRTHQIRVHMASIGHPVLGDHVYGGGSTQFEKKHPSLFSGQCLHAAELELTHPTTGERMTFTAPLPDNFGRILTLLSEE